MNEQFENVALEEVEEVVTTTNTKSNNGLKTVLGLGIVAGLVGGIVCLVKKNKDKINENRAKKLKKEGWVVLPPKTDEVTEQFDKLMDEVE